MVVISIIGLLSSITLASLAAAREKAKQAKALAELHQIRNAIVMLENDTNFSPSYEDLTRNGCPTDDDPVNRKLPISPCVANCESYLNDCVAGIQCTDGGFPNWKGPYMNIVPKDPWGTEYYFDPDLWCNRVFPDSSNIKQKECAGLPYDTAVRAITSFGPDKAQSYFAPGRPNDDVIIILCSS